MGYNELLTLEKSKKEIENRLYKKTRPQFRTTKDKEHASNQINFINQMTLIYTDRPLRELLTSSKYFELTLRQLHPHLLEEWSIYQSKIEKIDETSKLVPFFLVLTHASSEKSVENQHVDNNDVNKFFDMMSLQHWDELGKFYKSIWMLEHSINLLARIYLDLIISDIIHGYSTETIDGLTFEDLLIKYRTMKPKEFIRFCNGVSSASRHIEKLAIKENVYEQYISLAGVKSKQYADK